MSHQLEHLEWQIGEQSFPDGFPSERNSVVHASGALESLFLRAVSLILSAGLLATAIAPTTEQQSQLAKQQVIDSIVLLASQDAESEPATATQDLPTSNHGTMIGQDNWLDTWPDRSAIFMTRGEALFDVDIVDDMAIATLLISNVDREIWHYGPYRQKRLYQRLEDDWKAVAVTESILGRQRVLETAHLRFEIRHLELLSFSAVARSMEEIYVRLDELLSPGADSTLSTSDLVDNRNGKLTFVSIPNDIAGLIAVGMKQKISSPFVARAPANYSDEAWLSQLIVERMVYLRVRDAVAPQGDFYQYRWERTAWALNGWLQKELLGRRSPWHQQAADRFDPSSFQDSPVRLSALLSTDANAWPKRNEMMFAYMLAESMIEYAVSTYGYDKLSLLAHGLSRYHTWAHLIPAVFGVPVDEFEVGWNAYLAEIAKGRQVRQFENQIGAED